ncbi:hypothetical protein DICPUDRAFT_80317 [Dictyostelium purpureum]|uniref:RNB domain-containing protein n=1 Tax=Dictyostelium purpureum TaxID=5786 RepID=F0ZQ51_DICPU|nr:uncharacterized protein DICPUDRAFT_80317 [Dictyostelium purpureum]EGC33924.1 hypothetical protein DICPUDRAFT_80317 [Dictyostelium purpureum]|eukprot:XP_003289559.1 hypothetical protein DICPUDRAFT_80317 [Dictyostelium purpureum]
MLKYKFKSNTIHSNTSLNILRSFISTKSFNNNNNNNSNNSNNTSNNSSFVNRHQKFKGKEEVNLLNVIKLPKNKPNKNEILPILEKKEKPGKQEIKKEAQLKKKLGSLENEKKKVLSQIKEFDETPDALKMLFESGIKKRLQKKLKEIENEEIEIKKGLQENIKHDVEENQVKKESMSMKDLDTMKLLFGTDFEGEAENKPKTEIDTVVEFMYQDRFYIGVVKNILSSGKLQVERLVTKTSGKYSTDTVSINRSDVSFYWKDLFGAMNINELIEMDSSYQSFKFQTNIVNDTKLALFKNEYKFTTDQVAKVLYNVREPTKKQLYSTFKYLSTSDTITKPEDDRLGYEFVKPIDNKERLDQFIKKIKSILNRIKEESFEKSNIIHQFDHNDTYYLNIIKLLSISPRRNFVPDSSYRVILKELGYENSSESAKKLLEDIGFVSKVPEDVSFYNKNLGLWSKEIYEYSKIIETQPNLITDLLSSIRINFDKPVISIDPSSTLGIDDAISIDCESSDRFNTVYIHISDFIRWMPDGTDNILYKSALLNLKTFYPPNGAYHMFPPSLVKILSLSNATQDNPTYAITMEINFDKSTSQIESYKIYPTSLTSVIPLSQSIVTKRLESIIQNPKNANEEEFSLGERILYTLYKFTRKRQAYRESNKTSLESYGRVNQYKKEIRIKQSHSGEENNNYDVPLSTLSQKRPHQSLAHEIVDEILSSVDDIFTEIFQSKGIYGFYKYFGQPNYKRISPKSSFLTITSPIRNFTHLFTQYQLKSLLLNPNANTKDPKLFFDSDYTTSVGDQVIKTIGLKKKYQINIVNFVLLKAIESEIEKQKMQNIQNPDFKAVLEGSILSVNPSKYHFVIFLHKFQYSANCTFSIPQNQKSTPFRVNDRVKVTVESIDLNNLSLKLNFDKFIDRSLNKLYNY